MILRAIVVVFGAIALTPIALPYLVAITTPAAWTVWREADRLAELFGTTLALTALTLLFSMPIGIAISFAFVVPLARLNGFMFAAALSIPLPILTISGSILAQSGTGAWSPFLTGLPAAVCAHVWLAVPWIVWIVGPSLRNALNQQSADVRLNAPAVVRGWLALRASNRAILFAALWVAVQTTGEIVATDMARVRTLAEETYSQFVSPGSADGPSADLALSRAVLTTLPVTVALAAFLFVLARPEILDESLQHFATQHDAIANWNSIAFGIAVLFLGVAWMGLPVIALAHAANTGEVSSLIGAVHSIGHENYVLIATSLFGALLVGMFVMSMAAALSLAARKHPRSRAVITTLAVLCLTVPGPILGVGLHQLIRGIVAIEERMHSQLLRSWLYDGPSLLPVWWVHAIRSWPLAMVALWPVVRALPCNFGESSRLESGSAMTKWRFDVVPRIGLSIMAAILLSAAISLGEISASKIVATPGGEILAHDLFARMHYGISPDLAGLALASVALSGILGTALAICLTRTIRSAN